MEVATIEFVWHAATARWLQRPKSGVGAHGFLSELIEPRLIKDRSTIEPIPDMLRTGAPGPNPDFPEFLFGHEEGVQLEHSNGISSLDHDSYDELGCIVLRSKDLADYLDAAFAIVWSDSYQDPNASFGELDVPIIASGEDACGEYLRAGGQRRRITSSGTYLVALGEEPKYRVYVSQNIDGEFMWVDERTGDVAGPTGTAAR